MNKFDGILFCTDLDGTLFRDDKTVSKENLDAIEYFKSEGGYFTFVTGRMPFYATRTCELIKPNAPFGCVNGGGVYDAQKGEYIWNKPTPAHAVELMAFVDKEFPNVGMQINTFYKTYFCKYNDTMRRFRSGTGLPDRRAHYYDVKEPIGKVIFGSDIDEEILALRDALLAHPLAKDFDFIRSELTLYEILPKGIGKGVALSKIAEYLRVDENKTIAIGDYNNDISMFRAARYGIAVANACQDALDAADLVTVSNEEHAIARVISDIENGNIAL